jgi:hypothetical protein
MGPTRFPGRSPDFPLLVRDTGDLIAGSDISALADSRGAPLQPRMNIVPFRHPIYRRRPAAPAPSPSPQQLRSRAEVGRLVYGAGMFVLGIVAHTAWLRVWL